jgi:ribosomal protein L7/L12
MYRVEVYDCRRRAETIAAIKYVRQLRGLGLSEAKGLIDDVYCRCAPIRLDFDHEAEAVDFTERMAGFGFQCRSCPPDTP